MHYLGLRIKKVYKNKTHISFLFTKFCFVFHCCWYARIALLMLFFLRCFLCVIIPFALLLFTCCYSSYIVVPQQKKKIAHHIIMLQENYVSKKCNKNKKK